MDNSKSIDEKYDALLDKLQNNHKISFTLRRESIAFNKISACVNVMKDHLRYASPGEDFKFFKNERRRRVTAQRDFAPNISPHILKNKKNEIDYMP